MKKLLAIAIIVLMGRLASAQVPTTNTNVRAADGTAAAPSISFISDTNTGIYRIGADSIGFSAGGTLRFTISTAGATLTTPSLFPSGSSGAPSIAFSAETTLGLYRKSSGGIGITGHTLPSTDNTFDFGGTSQNWRNGAFKGYVFTGKITVGYQGTTVTDANNIVLRSLYYIAGPAYGAGALQLVKGDESALGDISLARIASGSGADPSFGSLGGPHRYWDFNTGVVTTPVGGVPFHGFRAIVDYEPASGGPQAQSALGHYTEFDVGATGVNFTHASDAAAGLYVGTYSNQGTNSTFVDLNGLTSDTEHGTSGTVSRLFAFKGWCCSFDAGMTTAGLISHSGFFHATQPFQGATSPTRHTAIWIEDQTAGATFTPTTNEAMHVDTASGTEDFKIMANGDVTAANMKLSTAVARPTCASGVRGTFWYVAGAGGVADTVSVCAKDAANAYAWRTIY